MTVAGVGVDMTTTAHVDVGVEEADVDFLRPEEGAAVTPPPDTAAAHP